MRAFYGPWPRGLGLRDQHQLVLKYQQATPLESAGMPLWLGLILTHAALFGALLHVAS